MVFSVGKDGLPRALQTLSTALIVSSGSDQGDDSSTGLRAPLYVLVNENTASAAEVLAAALKVTLRCLHTQDMFYTSTIHYFNDALNILHSIIQSIGEWSRETYRSSDIWQRFNSDFRACQRRTMGRGGSNNCKVRNSPTS